MSTLYKKDSKGKIRSLEIYTIEGKLYQKSGLLDGKKVEHAKECKPKNIGRRNATTPKTQAKLEAKALRTKKLREGYFDTIEDAEASNVISPMLAKDYFKEKHKIKKQEIAVQPKLDGIRCVVSYDLESGTIQAKTRNNKPIDNIPHILEELKSLINVNFTQDWIFDGELFKEGKTFQEVTKLVKNKPKKEDMVEYWVYDIIDPNLTFKERHEELQSLVLSGNTLYCKEVSTTINPVIPLSEEYANYISQGYEGMMIRLLHSKYKINGRSSDLLKYKEFIDVALPIVDITPNDAKPEHGTVWVRFNGHLQKTGAKLSHEDREDLLTNKDDYIGKVAEIRYFEKTDEGRMRFPVYHGIRIDK